MTILRPSPYRPRSANQARQRCRRKPLRGAQLLSDRSFSLPPTCASAACSSLQLWKGLQRRICTAARAFALRLTARVRQGLRAGSGGDRLEARWQPIFERKQPPMAEVEEPGVRQDVTHASRPDYPGRRSGAGSLIAASASAVSATTALAFAMPLPASSRK